MLTGQSENLLSTSTKKSIIADHLQTMLHFSVREDTQMLFFLPMFGAVGNQP